MTVGYGLLAAIALVALLVCAVLAAIFVHRLAARAPGHGTGPDDDAQAGEIPRALGKLRKRQPLDDRELAVARRVIGDRRSPLAFAIPAGIFSLGCFFVLGSLEQLHGATPSERTFLGVIPIMSSLNMTVQLIKSRRLVKRLPAERAHP